MSEWKEYNITEVCDTISDTYKDNAPKVVLINTSDVLEGKITNHEFVDNKNLAGQFKKLFQKDDILYSEIRPANKRYAYVDIIPKNYIASTKLMVLRSKPCILPKYLYYLLTNNRTIRELQAIAVGRSGTFPQITYSELANIKFLLPSIEEQNKILSILLDIDSKIECNRKICANLEAQAQALFKNWFVDFAPFKNGKFVESEFGMIPEGWRVGTLSEVMDILPGGTPKTSNPEFWENGTIPFFSPKDVKGIYCFDTESYITQVGLDNCSSKLYEKDTIFITCRGTVGKVVLAASPMAMNQSNYALRGKEGISQYYLYYVIVSLVNQLKKLANGSTFAAITTRDFSVKIAMPPLNEIEKFHCICEPLFEQIYTMGLENLRLATLRDTLLPKLMSGEIKI